MVRRYIFFVCWLNINFNFILLLGIMVFFNFIKIVIFLNLLILVYGCILVYVCKGFLLVIVCVKLKKMKKKIN